MEHFGVFVAGLSLLTGLALLLIDGAGRALKQFEPPCSADRARAWLQVIVFLTGGRPVAWRRWSGPALVPVRARPRAPSGDFLDRDLSRIFEQAGVTPAGSRSARSGRSLTPPAVSSADVYPATSPLDPG